MVTIMKYIKYLAIAMVLVAMVACGDDEPQSTYQRDFNMIYTTATTSRASMW